MICKEEYIERRLKVLDKMEANSVLILFAGVGKKRTGDQDYPFEVNRNFYYLTGIEQENSVLMLVKADGENHTFIFVDRKDENVEKWLGIKLTNEEVSNISGISNVLLREILDAKIDGAIKEKTLFGDIKYVYLDLEKELKIDECTSTLHFKDKLIDECPYVEIKDASDILLKLRMVKSPAEIEMIKEAIKSTEIGLKNVLIALTPGRYEYNIRNIFEFNVKQDCDAGIGFDSIVASGKNAVILHYPDAKDSLSDGDLILLDVGARRNLYCADISRTYPINGNYSPLQSKIYSIVLECNKLTAKFMKPGISLMQANEFAKNFMAEECVAQGLIEKKEDIDRVYYHSVGHHLGLDVHDGPVSTKKMILEPGNVVTCEPGLYFKEFGIGVRIEDDVLITENGSEVLSKDIIKEIKDIERILITR